MTLFTFGYEGLTIETFIVRLQAEGVTTVLDVRQLPLSRKRGFSKASFKAALEDASIVYQHLSALGCPTEIRRRYKETGDWAAYAKAYNAYLARRADDVVAVVRIAKRGKACLVCFEADFTRCHRSLISRAAERAGAPRAIHLAIKAEMPAAAGRVAA